MTIDSFDSNRISIDVNEKDHRLNFTNGSSCIYKTKLNFFDRLKINASKWLEVKIEGKAEKIFVIIKDLKKCNLSVSDVTKIEFSLITAKKVQEVSKSVLGSVESDSSSVEIDPRFQEVLRKYQEEGLLIRSIDSTSRSINYEFSIAGSKDPISSTLIKEGIPIARFRNKIFLLYDPKKVMICAAYKADAFTHQGSWQSRYNPMEQKYEFYNIFEKRRLTDYSKSRKSDTALKLR